MALERERAYGLVVESRAKCPRCVTGYLVLLRVDEVISCDSCSSKWELS